jgi:hypothetical protein
MSDLVERLRYVSGIKSNLDRDKELLAEAAAEIERLREQVASLQASSGYEASIAQVEIERLLDALNAIECHSIDHTDACRMAGKARVALEPKP